LGGNKVKEINFYLTMSDFVLINRDIERYNGGKKIHKQVKIDDLIQNKNSFDDILSLGFNKVEKLVDFTSFTFIEENVSISYLEERKTKGDSKVILHKNINVNEVSSFYKFEVWLEIKGVKIRPGQYIENVIYPDDIIIVFDDRNHWHLGRMQIPAPMEPRISAHLVPKKDIDKVIGIKRFKNIEWLGTEMEDTFTGEKEEYILDLNQFEESVYQVFLQHEALTIS
jgi:hypothetical protein